MSALDSEFEIKMMEIEVMEINTPINAEINPRKN